MGRWAKGGGQVSNRGWADDGKLGNNRVGRWAIGGGQMGNWAIEVGASGQKGVASGPRGGWAGGQKEG